MFVNQFGLNACFIGQNWHFVMIRNSLNNISFKFEKHETFIVIKGKLRSLLGLINK